MSDFEVEVRMLRGQGSGVYKLTPDSKITDLLEELDQNPETVVVRLNGKIVPAEEKLEDGDKLEIVPVVSGG